MQNPFKYLWNMATKQGDGMADFVKPVDPKDAKTFKIDGHVAEEYSVRVLIGILCDLVEAVKNDPKYKDVLAKHKIE